MKSEHVEGSVIASPDVWPSDTLDMSSLPGFEPDDGTIPDTLNAQVHQRGANHTAVLDAAGLKLDDIVAGDVYLLDRTDDQPMNNIYREYFSRGPSVQTCLMLNSGTSTPTIKVHP